MDPITYRCGFAVEKRDKETGILKVEPIQNAYYNLNSMMKKIFKVTQAEKYEGYLTSSDKSNFRFEIYPDYKSNRKDARKPIYYTELRDYMVKNYGARVISGEEADDKCSIRQIELNTRFVPEDTNSIVCSFDKDFNNIPGWHYNYVKDEMYFLTELEALRNFYLQILTGDTSDGVPRIKKGWLKKKTEQKLYSCLNEKEMLAAVKDVCYNVLKSEYIHVTDIDKILLQRGQLVWLRRKENEMWEPPR